VFTLAQSRQVRWLATGAGRDRSVLEVRDLVNISPLPAVCYGETDRCGQGVDGLSFTIQPGEPLPSWGNRCGKTTLANLILAL